VHGCTAAFRTPGGYFRSFEKRRTPSRGRLEAPVLGLILSRAVGCRWMGVAARPVLTLPKLRGSYNYTLA
jgi:hypothetical protein